MENTITFNYCEQLEKSFQHPYRIDILEGVLKLRHSFHLYLNGRIKHVQGDVINIEDSKINPNDKDTEMFMAKITVKKY